MGEHGPLPKQNTVRRNKREVAGVIPTGRPTMPAGLTVEAKAEWRRVVPALADAGVLAQIDRALLIRYCAAWADWVDLDAQLVKTGRLVQGQKGNLVRNPIWLLRRDAAAELLALSVQLGLTPAARGSVPKGADTSAVTDSRLDELRALRDRRSRTVAP